MATSTLRTDQYSRCRESEEEYVGGNLGLKMAHEPCVRRSWVTNQPGAVAVTTSRIVSLVQP